MLETHKKLCMTKPDFLDLLTKLGIWTKNGMKTGFFEFIEYFVINFSWICLIVNIYIICCFSAQILYLGKFFIPEIYTKICSANKTGGFFNQPYLQNKSMKLPDFLHVDTNLHRLEKWMWSAWSQTQKLIVSQNFIEGMSQFFVYCCKLRKAKSYFSSFWVGMVKNGHGNLIHETLKSTISY